MNLSKGIWERTGSDVLGRHSYAGLVGLAFAWTVVLVSIFAGTSYTWPFSWALLIGTFVGAVVGIWMFTASEAWPMSLLGISIMSACLGLMIGPVINLYEAEVVVKALVTTAGITVVMSIVGIVMPQSLEGLGGFLLGGLTLLIVGNFARVLMPMFGIPGDALGILDWVGAGLFTIYIVYDWNRAMRLPHTVDNAVDVAGALILDVVNLLLTLLRLYGKGGRKG